MRTFLFAAFRLAPCAFLLLSACSSVPTHRPTDLADSVTATRVILASAQAAAAAIHAPDVATRAAVASLQSQLKAVGVSFDSMSGKISWYENDWTRLDTENKGLKTDNAKLKTSLHQTAKERDFYPWLIAFCAGWAMLRALTPTLSAGLKVAPYIGPFLAMAAPEITFSIGAALGFTGARMLATYGSRLIP